MAPSDMTTSAPAHSVPLSSSSWPLAFSVVTSAAAFYWLTRCFRSQPIDHSPKMSPDIVSSLFPDRPIRPLPKRRLRERLSPEVADAIKYPPSTHDPSPLFYYPPCTLNDEIGPPGVGSLSPGYRPEAGRSSAPRRSGAGFPDDGYDEESVVRSKVVARSPPEILTRASLRPSRPNQTRYGNPKSPHSATSSIDGYDSLENTNNKKKRKIPSAGDSSLSGTHALNDEISSLAISKANFGLKKDLNDEVTYSQTSTYSAANALITSAQGISGPGRGRMGRTRNGRSPLRTLPDGNNTWAGRAYKTAPAQVTPSGKFISILHEDVLSDSRVRCANSLSPGLQKASRWIGPAANGCTLHKRVLVGIGCRCCLPFQKPRP